MAKSHSHHEEAAKHHTEAANITPRRTRATLKATMKKQPTMRTQQKATAQKLKNMQPRHQKNMPKNMGLQANN